MFDDVSGTWQLQKTIVATTVRIFDHVFISSMGVHPSAMHHGVGADLLANALADADEARLPTYLVCDSSLVPVFRKFGFAPGGERALGAVVLRGMLRTIHVADVLDRWGSRRHHRPSPTREHPGCANLRPESAPVTPHVHVRSVR